MPIYEFVCNDCGNEFEQIRRWSDESEPACVSCESEHVVRRMSQPAIHFKGSGWYITDSKKGEGKNGANGSRGSASNNGTEKDKSESSTEKAEDKKEKIETKEAKDERYERYER